MRDLPEHHSFVASMGFTKVRSRSSPFPPDDPGAPFHKRDYTVMIKKATDPECQPLTFKTEQPVGYYYVVLRVMLGREIRGNMSIQIENFPISDAPVEVRPGATLQVNGFVTWPTVTDDKLHFYGHVDELV